MPIILLSPQKFAHVTSSLLLLLFEELRICGGRKEHTDRSVFCKNRTVFFQGKNTQNAKFSDPAW